MLQTTVFHIVLFVCLILFPNMGISEHDKALKSSVSMLWLIAIYYHSEKSSLNHYYYYYYYYYCYYNQNYNKILECDWLSAARFELDNKLDRQIGQCTCRACNWTVSVIFRTLLRCTLLSKLLCFSAFITTFNRLALNWWFVHFLNFVIVLINR